MCGLTGFILGRPGPSDSELKQIADTMSDTLRHRGPDDQGSWVDPVVGIALGHRRLSILDLSAEGHQPMVSASGRFVLAYNGEIYNFAELRTDLEKQGCRWRGHSDTEVVLEALAHWGIENAVSRFVGMFAFALWDNRERVVWLVRDRLGIKPLYYGWSGQDLLFASELKAIRAFPNFTGEIDPAAVTLFMGHSCIPAPHTIFRGVFKLTPGHLLRIPLAAGGGARSMVLEPHPYWSIEETTKRGLESPFPGGREEAVDQLEKLLHQAVGLRMVADVPLGAFLSGGTDSSLVAALMQAQSSKPIKTFTIGNQDERYNEADQARRIARHLGTDHTELCVTPADALAIIPNLPNLFDEPFADVSQIPTMLVSQLARRDVKVVLSGDGGDELFAGYLRHLWGPRLWRWIRFLPGSLRQRMGIGGTKVLGPVWLRMMNHLPHGLRLAQPEIKLTRSLKVYSAKSLEDVYLNLVCPARDTAVESPWGNFHRWPCNLDDVTRMTCSDLCGFLPDDILVKVDRTSMSVGLETRVPLLDHRVVEFSLGLPSSFKINRGGGKWLLKQLLKNYFPDGFFNRPKMGFVIPIGVWLRGPLREWAEDLLAEDRLVTEGIYSPAKVTSTWREHLSGIRDHSDELWKILMYQAWRR
jgi:asparagine synthase (glutamine-hydrolysing)